MLPLSKERALELFEQDLTIYAILDGGEASMALTGRTSPTTAAYLQSPARSGEHRKNLLTVWTTGRTTRRNGKMLFYPIRETALPSTSLEMGTTCALSALNHWSGSGPEAARFKKRITI